MDEDIAHELVEFQRHLRNNSGCSGEVGVAMIEAYARIRAAKIMVSAKWIPSRVAYEWLGSEKKEA